MSLKESNKKLLLVKISNGKERFWVKVIKIIDGVVTGTIDNELDDTSKYDFGDTVSFPIGNVIQFLNDKTLNGKDEKASFEL